MNLITATFALVVIELAFWSIAGGYALRVYGSGVLLAKALSYPIPLIREGRYRTWKKMNTNQ